MPARDRYHNEVRQALIKDGWTITHDPLRLTWGAKDMYVDLGAELFLAAEKGAHKIAVEIKGFSGLSEMDDLEKAIGQYILYHDVLDKVEPERKLYVAISEVTFAELFEEPIGKLLLDNRRMKLLVFDPQTEEIRQWTPESPTAP